jgi:hypothetical protein
MHSIPADTAKIDSTAQLKVHVWRLNLMISEINAGRICDSLVKQQDDELLQAKKLQSKTEEALVTSKEQTSIAKIEADTWSKRYDIKNLQVEEANKNKRRFRNERNVAILLDILLIVILIL